MRGGLQKKPINWSNANITSFRFTNQLVLNPIWNLGMTLKTASTENFLSHLETISISTNKCNEIVQQSLQNSNTEFLSEDYPALRKTKTK